CWGLNRRGQLGNGTTVDRRSPAPVDRTGVLAGKTLTRMNAGGSHTCAVDTLGRAYCWGADHFGQLGAGSRVRHYRLRPIAVDRTGALSGKMLTGINAGTFHTCALSRAGRAYCWGANGYGQLGTGTTTDQRVPAAVKGPLA
ncbi:MAG: hypothetical protein WAN48_13370, partial [Actinomycetes bacterium]